MRSHAHTFLVIIVLTLSAHPSYAQKPSGPNPPPLPAVEYNPNAWKEYSSQRGLFTILFPGTPIEEDNFLGAHDRRIYSLKTSVYYQIRYIDLRSDLPNELVREDELLKLYLDALAKQNLGKILSESEISLDGHLGRLQKRALPRGGIAREKTYAVRKRIYHLVVITPEELLVPNGGPFYESWATKFLDSFKLIKPPPAIEDKPAAWKIHSSIGGHLRLRAVL